MKSALLVMDIVSSILQMNPHSESVICNIAKAIQKARQQQIPIIYIKPAFRQGLPEISSNNKMFSMLKPLLQNVHDDKFHPLVQPQDNDLIVGKFRIVRLVETSLKSFYVQLIFSI